MKVAISIYRVFLIIAVLLISVLSVSKAQAQLTALLSPSSRSVQVGTPATVFVTLTNVGAQTATACGIAPLTLVPAVFSFQAINSATNTPTGTSNTFVDIPAKQAQRFVLTFTPIVSFTTTEVQLYFGCTNTNPAVIVSGLNTLLLSASKVTTVQDGSVVTIFGSRTSLVGLLGYGLATLLLAILATFLMVGLIYLFLRPRYWLYTWTAYLLKNVWPRIWYTKQQRVTPAARLVGLGFHWFAEHLESWGLLRLLSVLSHIGIVIAMIALVLTYLAYEEEAPVRKETLKAFKEEAKDREAGAEGRAWSLIYQSKGSPGDGGRIHALEYLNNKEKKASLVGLPLAKAYLIGVKLPKANLSKANLSEANLFRATLLEANLSEANLSEAILREATLLGANLFSANLSKANLSEANLFKATLVGANLSGADLSETRNLRQEQIDSAFHCEQWNPPILPAEFKPPPVQRCDRYGNPKKE